MEVANLRDTHKSTCYSILMRLQSIPLSINLYPSDLRESQLVVHCLSANFCRFSLSECTLHTECLAACSYI